MILSALITVVGGAPWLACGYLVATAVIRVIATALIRDADLYFCLSQRQLSMIAFGGVIGAGLFVGSGMVIGDTGPAAFLTYALCGVLVALVMRMMGEMAAANPSTGSFADYAATALGGLGRVFGGLAVLVLLGDRRRIRSRRRRQGPRLLVPRPAVGAVAVPDGVDDGDQPVLGDLVR